MPSGAVAWSPRLGFNYRLTSGGQPPVQVRGGAGLFTGRPPLFWLFGGFSAYGLARERSSADHFPATPAPHPCFAPTFEILR